MYHVYILECSDGSLYTGISNRLAERVARHNTGKASRCTAARLPVRLVYSEEQPDKGAALKREYAIKRLSRQEKIVLIEQKNCCKARGDIMKIVAFNGSPRRDGNTARALSMALAELAAQGVEGELIHVAGGQIRGCLACHKCHQPGTGGRCAITGDPVNGWIDKIKEADGVLLGSPVYFQDVTSDMKAFIDRVGFVARGNGRIFARKAGAAVVVERRLGAIHTMHTLLDFFMAMQMYIVGCYSVLMGEKPGETDNDAEGLKNLSVMSGNLAVLLKALSGNKQN